MSRKITKRKAPAVAGHEPAFREIIGLIAAARRRAFQAVNTELIDLYWRVGSQKVAPVVRQISRRSKAAALLRQIKPTAKTLATGERIEMYARPPTWDQEARFALLKSLTRSDNISKL